ncbi:polyprenyl synthetase family protein, partial [Micromonospora sp. DH15]|nr:polyprenyl synthetase family protein [Micromonospora sp. DH15]
VARLAELVADTGAVARVERRIADRVADALAALDTASIDETARTALTGLATAATARRA